jgi:hypothetical protein
MGTKYPKIEGNNENSWSDWLKPRMEKYQMACCDCGLVHTLAFKVLKQGKLVKEYTDGNHIYEYVEVKNPKYQVSLKARRDNRATGQLRRRRKKDEL